MQVCGGATHKTSTPPARCAKINAVFVNERICDDGLRCLRRKRTEFAQIPLNVQVGRMSPEVRAKIGPYLGHFKNF